MDHSNCAVPPLSPLPIQRIDPGALLQQLSAQARAYTLEIVECTGSTNTDLLHRWRAHPSQPQALIRLAYAQTAGKGRQGRRWQASDGDALLFSIACRFSRPVGELAGLSLAIGTALLDGLRALAPDPLQRLRLKWPNDVLLDHKKLAGILIETAQHTHHYTDTIIGIGLNLNLPPTLSDVASDKAGGDVAAPLSCAAFTQFTPVASMTQVFAALLNTLIPALERFDTEGFAPFVPAWLQDHAYTGCDACLLEHGREKYRGRIQGVDAQGRILLETATGVHAIASGDLSLRAFR